MAGFKKKGFIWKISICSSIAYLTATVPQIIVDPLLQHNLAFDGARNYRCTPFIIVPFLLVSIGTYYVMLNSRKIRWNISPFLSAILLSIPIFYPEIPHGNLVTVSFIWMFLLISTLWIRNREILIFVDSTDNTAKIEYLKEEVQFWRMVIIGLAGGFFAVFIAWENFLFDLNKFIVDGYAKEVVILNSMSFFVVGIMSIGLIICPLAEAVKKHRGITNLFLTIKKEKP